MFFFFEYFRNDQEQEHKEIKYQHIVEMLKIETDNNKYAYY